MRIKRNQLQKIIRQELSGLYNLNERSPDQTLPPPVKPEKSPPTLEEMGINPKANSLVKGSQVLNYVGMDAYKKILPLAEIKAQEGGKKQVLSSINTSSVQGILEKVKERAENKPSENPIKINSVQDLIDEGLMTASEVDTLREKFSSAAVRGMIEGTASATGMDSPTIGDYVLRALSTGAKMLIFGFFDNVIMIFAGEAIAAYFGGRIIFGVAIVGAMNEGIGNAISDVMAEFISQPVVDAVGINPEKYVTNEEMLDAPAYWQTLDETASSIGVFLGCIIGLAPLYFMSSYTRAATAALASAAASRVGGAQLSLFKPPPGSPLAGLAAPLIIGLLVGGIVHYGIDMAGEYKLSKAESKRTVQAFNNALTRVLIKSGMIENDGEGNILVDKELAPHLEKLLTKSLPQNDKDEVFSYLRKKIDRDDFEAELNPDAYTGDPYINLNIFTKWARTLMKNLGYLTLETHSLKISNGRLKKIIREEIFLTIKESREDRMNRISALYEPQRREREASLRKVHRRRPGRHKAVRLTIVTKEQAENPEEAVKIAIDRLNPDNLYPLSDFDYIGYDDDDGLHVISYSVDEY